MLLLYILNAVIILQLASGIYNYVEVKETTIDDQKTENTKNISLVIIIFLSLFLISINLFYLFDVINYKRTILNFILLSIIGSVFILINYIYLMLQQKSPTGYEEAKRNLENNSENTNQKVMIYDMISFIISFAITLLILSFYIGYQFFSRQKIKKIKEPVIFQNKKPIGRNIARLNLF